MAKGKILIESYIDIQPEEGLYFTTREGLRLHLTFVAYYI